MISFPWLGRFRTWFEGVTGRSDRHEVFEIEGPDGTPALIVRLSLEESRRRRKEAATGEGAANGADASLAPAVLDHLAAASVHVAHGLARGHVYQVVGPSPLVAGLRAGTHSLMQTKGGYVGVVTSSASGRIDGLLRFKPVSRLRLHSPVVLWTMLHMVAGTIQMREISSRLQALADELRKLRHLVEADRIARIRWASASVADLTQELRLRRDLTPDMSSRLAAVERDVGVVLQEKAHLLDRYEAGLRLAAEDHGKTAAERILKELDERDETAIDLWIRAMALDLRIEEIRLIASLKTSPEEAERRLAGLERKMSRYRSAIEALAELEQEASAHVRRCMEEMSWWERRVRNRSLAQKVPSEPPREDPAGGPGVDEEIPSYLFWRGDDGKLEMGGSSHRKGQ